MKFSFVFWSLVISIGGIPARAQIPHFEHIVIVVQENRTPDNLFQGLCGPDRSLCPKPYNLQDFGINSRGEKIVLSPVPLGIDYDLSHNHEAFLAMCDLNTSTNQCRMDGADMIHCGPKCPPNPQFEFVESSDVAPYLTLARQYGWANFMFQTNQGPSQPAHQFIFGGTSAPDADADSSATFLAENTSGLGCLAPLHAMVNLISPETVPGGFLLTNNPRGTFCFSRPTMASLLESKNRSWKYYAPGAFTIWTAPDFIREICMPNSKYTACTGEEWSNVVPLPQQVLADIAACKLPSVSWVVPSGLNSDHAGSLRDTGGPSWVASIVNAIGTSTRCDNHKGYWKNTAILVTWDDWGGWFDHEPPVLLSAPGEGQGDYQYGFRVPLVVVSAYTPAGYVSNDRLDFGSILRFVEQNFGIPMGALNFADKRALNDLSDFFDLAAAAHSFEVIPAPYDANYFLNDHSPMEPPDNE
jgi:phospholipase C